MLTRHRPRLAALPRTVCRAYRKTRTSRPVQDACDPEQATGQEKPFGAGYFEGSVTLHRGAVGYPMTDSVKTLGGMRVQIINTKQYLQAI